MPYPFQMGLKNMGETSHKLKILAVAGGVTVAEMCRQVVDHAYDLVDQGKIEPARKELERGKEKC